MGLLPRVAIGRRQRLSCRTDDDSQHAARRQSRSGGSWGWDIGSSVGWAARAARKGGYAGNKTFGMLERSTG